MATNTDDDRYLSWQVEEFQREMYNMSRTINGYITRAQGWKNARNATRFFNKIKEVKKVLDDAEKFKI